MPTTVNVFLRAKELTVEVDGDTVGQLKEKLLKIAAAATATTTITTTPTTTTAKMSPPQNDRDGCLLVFLHGTQLNDHETLKSGSHFYYAFEVFKIVPRDLYRTVEVKHVEPAVSSCHPTEFSKVAPLYCGAFKAEEAQLPSFHLDENQTAVRGASLSYTHPKKGDDASSFAEICPADDVGTRIGESSYDCSLLTSPGKDRAAKFGKLLSPDLVDNRRLPLKLCDVSVEEKKKRKEREKKHQPTRRVAYFCFKLPHGENLEEVGAAVVFDNIPEGHFALIQWPLPPDTQAEVNVDEQGGWALRRRDFYQRDEVADVPLNHPEWIDHKYGPTTRLFALPFVAMKFQLHCFVIKASAEPCDDDLEPEQNRTLLAAARILHRHPQCDLEGLFALAALSETHFDVTQVAYRHLCTLLENCNEVLSRVVEDDDGDDDDGDDDWETLQGGIQTIERELERRSTPFPKV